MQAFYGSTLNLLKISQSDERLPQDCHWQLYCFGNSDSLLIFSPFMTVACETRILFTFSSLHLWFFGQDVMVTHHLRPGWIMATDTLGKSWHNLYLHCLPGQAFPSLFSSHFPLAEQLCSYSSRYFQFSLGGLVSNGRSYYSYFLVLLGMLLVFTSFLVFHFRMQTLNFTKIGCEGYPQCECTGEQHTLRSLMCCIPSTISSLCSGERQSMVCFLHLVVQIVTTST